MRRSDRTGDEYRALPAEAGADSLAESTQHLLTSSGGPTARTKLGCKDELPLRIEHSTLPDKFFAIGAIEQDVAYSDFEPFDLSGRQTEVLMCFVRQV
jgi:hypothetical protein